MSAMAAQVRSWRSGSTYQYTVRAINDTVGGSIHPSALAAPPASAARAATASTGSVPKATAPSVSPRRRRASPPTAGHRRA